jgi:phosphopantetheine--protein transferase-like protein
MLGVDLVHIPEFERQLELGGQKFLYKAFSPEELRNQQLNHLAGLWAAKEAVLKAGGLKAGQWSSIIISHEKSGKPLANYKGKKFEISIAHHGEYAVAVALEI